MPKVLHFFLKMRENAHNYYIEIDSPTVVAFIHMQQ